MQNSDLDLENFAKREGIIMHVVNNNVERLQATQPAKNTSGLTFQGIKYSKSLHQDNFYSNKTKLHTNDNVTFTGLPKFLTSKGGKLGLLGAGLLLLSGCTATIYTTRTHHNRTFYGPPPVITPSQTNHNRVMVYVDNHGNWGVKAVQGTSYVPPGMIEYERVFTDGHAAGWRKITRVHNGHGKVIIRRGGVIRQPYPCGPHTPPWMRNHMRGMRHGHTIVVPPSFPPPHHRRW